MSNFFTPEFNNESAIAPWNASLEPTKAIIPKLDANPVLTGGVGQEVNIPTLTPEAYDNIILPDASLTRMASAVSTDSNSSLPDSSVDLLTGQAMSEVYGDLSKFAADPDFAAKLNVPFGENWDAAAAKTLAEAWFKGDFSDIPPVKVVSSAEIGGANGAFAAATDTIYLSREFLAGNAANPAAVADVLLEEIGHSVDARLNVTDSPGDEGAIFSRVVQGKELTQGELQALKSEDDIGTVVLGGEDTTIEMNQQQWRVWRYADWRNSNFNWQRPDGSRDQNGNRPDGKDGININWGQGSPFDSQNTDIVNPLDYFATSGATQATFEAGKTYKFRVSADDALIMAATQIGKSNFNFITPLSQDRKQVEWQTFPNGIFKEYSWTPSQSGQYYVYFWHYDKTGDADLNISWEKVGNSGISSEKVGNPDIDIQLFYPNGGFTDAQKNIFEQAAANWENAITKDKVTSGVLKIAITQNSKGILGTNWGSDIASETYPEDEQPPKTRKDWTNNLDGENQIHFNSAFINGFSKNNLIRLTMHEIGHTLGLNEAQNDSTLYDTARDSLMDLRQPAQGGQDMKITEGMNKRLESLGYEVNRSPSINWF